MNQDEARQAAEKRANARTGQFGAMASHEERGASADPARRIVLPTAPTPPGGAQPPPKN